MSGTGALIWKSPIQKATTTSCDVPYETGQELDELVDELNRDAPMPPTCVIVMSSWMWYKEMGKIWN